MVLRHDWPWPTSSPCRVRRSRSLVAVGPRRLLVECTAPRKATGLPHCPVPYGVSQLELKKGPDPWRREGQWRGEGQTRVRPLFQLALCCWNDWESGLGEWIGGWNRSGLDAMGRVHRGGRWPLSCITFFVDLVRKTQAFPDQECRSSQSSHVYPVAPWGSLRPYVDSANPSRTVTYISCTSLCIHLIKVSN
jgi:hypothetical protein